MSLDDGLFDEMRRRHDSARLAPLGVDEATATRLLAGHLPPVDAPPGYGTVATVLRAAAAPSRPEELAAEAAARHAFRAARPVATTPRRHARPTRLAALVVAGVLLLGGVTAAASTGSLPGPAQSAAHDALGTLGVSVPVARRAAPSTRRAAARHSPVGHAPVTTAPRVHRATPHPPSPPPAVPSHATAPPRPTRGTLATNLCRSAAAGSLNPHGSPAAQHAYRTLAQLAGGAAHIPGYCRGVLAAG